MLCRREIAFVLLAKVPVRILIRRGTWESFNTSESVFVVTRIQKGDAPTHNMQIGNIDATQRESQGSVCSELCDETGRGKSVQTTGARMSGRGTGAPTMLYTFSCFSVVPLSVGGRESVVGISTRYGLEVPRIESPGGTRFTASVQTGPGAHPASHAMGTGSLSRR